MATDIQVKTLFTVHSSQKFILNQENAKFFVPEESVVYKPDSYAYLYPSQTTLQTNGDATAAPDDVLNRSFLRITTDHPPKQPSVGYLFGRDSEICDIFLGRSEVKSVGRRHFAIQVVMHHGEPSLLFRSFASYGTTVRSHTLGNQRIETQRSIPTGEREYVINIGPLQLRLEFPDHSRHSELWRDHLACHYGGHVFQTPRVAHVKARANDNVWTKHYHDISWIGSGGYGTVYRAQHNFSGAIHAVKELKVNRCRRSEIKLRDLLLLKNDHLIQFIEIYDNPPAVVMEFASHPNLRLSHHQETLDECETEDVIFQLSLAVDYLHKRRITRRDVKPSNVLVVVRLPRIYVKLSDLSSAINEIQAIQTCCSTPLYCAPELGDRNYTSKVDIWSLGVLALELWYHLPSRGMATRRGAQRGIQMMQIKSWAKLIIQHLRKVSAEPRASFLSLMLQMDPRNRVAAHVISGHRDLIRAALRATSNSTGTPIPSLLSAAAERSINASTDSTSPPVAIKDPVALPSNSGNPSNIHCVIQ
ncbi:kinase-like domain-containing protein [Nemania diffusa]|nr:kinase-like domain-containing protein [Nemania diffusa]